MNFKKPSESPNSKNPMETFDTESPFEDPVEGYEDEETLIAPPPVSVLHAAYEDPKSKIPR